MAEVENLLDPLRHHISVIKGRPGRLKADLPQIHIKPAGQSLGLDRLDARVTLI